MQTDIHFDLCHPQPLLIVISGPSGVGKTAVVRWMKEKQIPLHYIITATSREPRMDECHGRDYYFYSKTEFKEKIDRGDFIEHAWVYSQYKGIPRSQLEEAFQSGKDAIISLDVQGARTIRKLYPEALLIFLVPATKEEWLARLQERRSETPENLKIRLDTATQEMGDLPWFDYIVVNPQDHLEKAAGDILSIISAEHHRVNHRQVKP